MDYLYSLLAGAVVPGLYGCGQGADAPTETAGLEVAAQVWNTPDKQWSETGLQQLLDGQLTLGAPALKNSAVAKGPARGLLTTVLFGRGTMPAFGKSINDADLALILSYVRNAWGNQQGDLIAAADVAAARATGK